MDRFRPNVVVAESAAHEEDGWQRLRIGEVELALAKQCERCAIPLVDPATASTGIEPLRTLAKYRKLPNSVKFGQYALVVAPGWLQVGMQVQVSKAGEYDSAQGCHLISR